MSVDKRRLAAAQRTAVRRRKASRKRRLSAWIVILPALALFSFSVVAGAAGARGKPGVAAAAAKVVPQEHGKGSDGGHGGSTGGGGGDNNNNNTKDQGGKDDGTLVVVDASHGDGGVDDLIGKGGREICWISQSQLVRVSAAYRTTTSTIKVGHTTYRLVTVFGADEKKLKQLLGTSAVQCRLVHVAHLFFLPFDPNLS